MEKNKVKYYLSLFIYSTKDKKPLFIDTLFRYFHIYIVSKAYLDISDENDNFIINIDNYRGVTNYNDLNEQLKMLSKDNYITTNETCIIVNQKLLDLITDKAKNNRMKSDLNQIMYFCDILTNYTDEVILNVFYNDPNVEDANKRNSKTINLNDNKLKKLLNEFELRVKKLNNIDLEKYDVLISWLNFVFKSYVK